MVLRVDLDMFGNPLRPGFELRSVQPRSLVIVESLMGEILSSSVCWIFSVLHPPPTGPVCKISGCTAVWGVLCSPVLDSLSTDSLNPVSFTKRHTSFNETVLMCLVSVKNFLKRPRNSKWRGDLDGNTETTLCFHVSYEADRQFVNLLLIFVFKKLSYREILLLC